MIVHKNIYNLCSLFAQAVAQNIVDVLFIVHPTSILEQHPDIRHVKSFLDKISNRINNFDGIIIVSILNRKFKNELYNQKNHLEGIAYADSFIRSLPSKVIVVHDSASNPDLLGSSAMSDVLDELYLNDRLGSIIVGGCFDCSYMNMCVNDTMNNLATQYGSDKIRLDPSIAAKAGPVFFEDDQL